MKQRTDDNRCLYRRLQEDIKMAINHYEAVKYQRLTDKLQQNWKSNPKNYWQNINRLRGLRTYNNHPLKINDQIILDDAEKVETFRQMLQETYQTPRSTRFNNPHLINTEKFVKSHPFLFNPQPSTPNYTLITTTELEKAIRTLKNMAPGPDGVRNIVWKKLPERIYVAKLFSASLNFGLPPHPPGWKEAHIMMFPKPKKIQEISNHTNS